ncbi:MAG: Cell division protein kinase 1 [Paramarteilia canceri]
MPSIHYNVEELCQNAEKDMKEFSPNNLERQSSQNSAESRKYYSSLNSNGASSDSNDCPEVRDRLNKSGRFNLRNCRDGNLEISEINENVSESCSAESLQIYFTNEREMKALFKEQVLIGKGSYSEVFRAINSQTYEIRALKKSFYATKTSIGLSGPILRELASLKGLIHPNIVKVYGLYFMNSCAITELEYLPFDLLSYTRIFQDKERILIKGCIKTKSYSCRMNEQSLRQLEWSHTQVHGILQALFNAICYMHRHKVMHRDLKPQNILICPPLHRRGVPAVRVADFNLSCILFDQHYKTKIQKNFQSSKVCTLWYRAPEVMLGGIGYNFALDIWSLGIIYFELLLTCPPVFEQNDNAQLERLISKFDINLSEFSKSCPSFAMVAGQLCQDKNSRSLLKSLNCEDFQHANSSDTHTSLHKNIFLLKKMILNIQNSFPPTKGLLVPQRRDVQLMASMLMPHPAKRCTALQAKTYLEKELMKKEFN